MSTLAQGSVLPACSPNIFDPSVCDLCLVVCKSAHSNRLLHGTKGQWALPRPHRRIRRFYSSAFGTRPPLPLRLWI